MRLIFSLLIGAMISLPVAAAPKQKSQFNGKFLTFSQLSALPKAKRMRYIHDLTELMVLMEKYNSQYEVAGGPSLQDLREQIAFLEQAFAFLPQAEARVASWRDLDKTKGIPAWNGRDWECPDGYEFNGSVPGCIRVSTAGSTMFPSSKLEGGGCPAGLVEIPHPDERDKTVRACMDPRNWAALLPERRSAILEDKGAWLNPNGFWYQEFQDQKEVVLGGLNHPSASGSANPTVAGSPAATAPASAGGAAAAPSGGAAPAAPAAGGVAVVPAPATPAAPAAPAAKPAEAAKPTVKPAPQVADKCIPEVTSCEAADANTAAISRFRKTAKYNGVDANKCIAGGFLSKYAKPTKQIGTCEIKTKITLGKGSFSCDPGEALCNPVLFCHTAKGKGTKERPMFFCIDRKKFRGTSNPQLTAECAREFSARIKKKGLVDGAPNEIPQACDPKDVKLSAGIQEDWNEMVKNMEDMNKVWCAGTADFAALFCRECQVISSKIYAMNKRATGSGCAPEDASGSVAEPAAVKPPETGNGSETER